MALAELQERLNEILGNKYQILCRIGGGGMAQVYLARHRLHGGLFAVKVLAEHLAQDPIIVSRFEQEARTAASLASHPNIVPIFDIGEGDGLHYLVMQFIAGEDLASFLRREGRLTPADAANVVAQATEALSCAEARRIVHRDLKLANMLLDESGRVKLLDFGISRITDIADGLTRPGESLGTPYYMSPEQIRGEGCDIRSDLYSLGVVFFELLSGQRPFENESATAIQIAHLSMPPPSLLALDPSLPPACDAIVQKLLAKRREERYQSTAELLNDLVAHGANAGAGTLRPTIDPGLRTAIEHAQAIRLDPPSTIPTTPAPPSRLPTETRPITPVAANAAMTALPAESTAATVPAATPASGFRPWMAVAMLVVLLLAGAGASLFLLRARHPAAPPPSVQVSTLPPVYSDAHGRMLLVPAGAFLSGGADEGEAKQLSLPAFYVDETEVSNAEYHRFCESTGHAAPQIPDYVAHPDYPVSGVSYSDAEAYAAWAGKRLPTEEEWEKAARGTDGRTFPWGDEPWTEDVPNHLQPVVSEPLRRSPYGAYNMAGNVWEWTATPFTPAPADLAAMKRLLGDQSFSAVWQTIKGGSFAPGGSDAFAVTKFRGLPTDARSPWIGFRCARDAGPAGK